MTKTAIHFFLIILLGALGSSALGALFAALIGGVAPEFVTDLFGARSQELDQPVRYAAVVGMIWGVFIGTAVACFACALSVAWRVLNGLRKVDLQVDEAERVRRDPSLGG